MSKLFSWFKSRPQSEKIMYLLIIAMVIGIATRWQYVWGEIGSAFASYFD